MQKLSHGNSALSETVFSQIPLIINKNWSANTSESLMIVKGDHHLTGTPIPEDVLMHVNAMSISSPEDAEKASDYIYNHMK